MVKPAQELPMDFAVTSAHEMECRMNMPAAPGDGLFPVCFRTNIYIFVFFISISTTSTFIALRQGLGLILLLSFFFFFSNSFS